MRAAAKEDPAHCPDLIKFNFTRSRESETAQGNPKQQIHVNQNHN